MARANSGHAARQNLPALLHELRQNVGPLIVDEVHLLDTKLANLLLAKILALATTWSSGSAWTSRTTFATWSMATARSAFTARSATRTTRSLCLFRFLCHTCLPFRILRISP